MGERERSKTPSSGTSSVSSVRSKRAWLTSRKNSVPGFSKYTHTQEKRSKTKQDWMARWPMTVYHCDEQRLQSKNNKCQLSLTRRHKQFRSLEKTDEASKRWCWFLEQVKLIISVICIRTGFECPYRPIMLRTHRCERKVSSGTVYYSTDDKFPLLRLTTAAAKRCF